MMVTKRNWEELGGTGKNGEELGRTGKNWAGPRDTWRTRWDQQGAGETGGTGEELGDRVGIEGSW